MRSQSALGANFRRLRQKLGAPKAITAMAHKLARLLYRMLKFGKDYVDRGTEYYETKYRQHRIKWLIKQAAVFDLQLTPHRRLAIRFLETASIVFGDGMRRPASSGMRYAPSDQRTRGAERKTGHEEEYH